MNWMLIFISFFGPLYDSNGFVSKIISDESLIYSSEISCKYTSSLINGGLKSTHHFKFNARILERKKALCITLNDWSRYKESDDIQVLMSNNLQNVLKNF